MGQEKLHHQRKVIPFIRYFKQLYATLVFSIIIRNASLIAAIFHPVENRQELNREDRDTAVPRIDQCVQYIRNQIRLCTKSRRLLPENTPPEFSQEVLKSKLMLKLWRCVSLEAKA